MQESITNQRDMTIQDIAVSASVSSTTVSMVLNGKAAQYRICTATRQRVEAVIAQSGYQPNRVARNMRLGRGTLVGLILAEGTQDVGELMAGLEPVLAAAGYSLVVVSGGTDPVTMGERIRRLNHDGLAGLIYGPGFPVGAAPLLAGLGPTMILGLPVGGLPGVYHEDEAGGQPSPVGTRRSERKRGQAASELLLALLAGSPAGNREIPLEHRAGEAVPIPSISVIVPPAVVSPLPPVTPQPVPTPVTVPVMVPVAAPLPIPVAPVIATASPPEAQPAPIIIESPVVTGVSPVPAAEEAIDATSISEAPVSAAPAPTIEDPQPPAAIESAIPAEPIVVEQPEAEEPQPVMVEPIPEPEPLPEPAPITIESTVVIDVSPVPEIPSLVPEPAAEETPVPGLEAQQPPPEVIEPASSLEPISAEQPVVEAPQPEAVPVVETPAQPPPEPEGLPLEPIPPEVIVPSPASVEEVPVTVLEPAVALEPETQQNPPSTEDQAEVVSNPITP
jgi:hypothetical protein